MAVNVSKIRLGAASQFLLAGSQDMGSTKGGVMIRYNQTQSLIECDQVLGPVAAFRTKEEGSIEAAFYETQMVKVGYAAGHNGLGSLTTTAGTPNVDKLGFGGFVTVPSMPADLTIPKNDGTTNNILVHANKVHGYKEIQLDFKRDADTTYKGTFNMLADPTQPVGYQLFYIQEQY